MFVISGDSVRTNALQEQSQNADLLVAEVMNKEIVHLIQGVNEEIGNSVNAKLRHDIQGYHMDVSDVGALSQEANVQQLALTHLAPKPQGRLEAKTFFRDLIEEIYAGELFVGEDGMRIAIPMQ